MRNGTTTWQCKLICLFLPSFTCNGSSFNTATLTAETKAFKPQTYFHTEVQDVLAYPTNLMNCNMIKPSPSWILDMSGSATVNQCTSHLLSSTISSHAYRTHNSYDQARKTALLKLKRITHLKPTQPQNKHPHE